jgi:cholesterol transport system auxiliary component
MAWTTAWRVTRRVAPLLLAVWLGACAAGGDPQAAFDLAPAAPRPQRTVHAQVHVLEPVVPTNLESDRILVRTGAAEAVLAGARWTGPLPALIQSRLSDSLQNAYDPRKVDGAVDYNLETDVRAFELDADQKQVVVELVVKLVSARDNLVVAVKTFKAQAPVASTDPGVVTAALNGALSSLMAQIVGFVAASV